MKEENEFNKIFVESVYDGLSLYGSSFAPMVLLYLKNIGSMESKLKIEDPAAFVQGLEKIFGFGARVFERKILEALYVKLQLSETPTEGFNFVEEIAKAKELLRLQTRCSCET